MSDNWPKRLDGTNMSVGEMSKEDRKRVFTEAVQDAIEKVSKTLKQLR
jgi:hypothetical protein